MNSIGKQTLSVLIGLKKYAQIRSHLFRDVYFLSELVPELLVQENQNERERLQ